MSTPNSAGEIRESLAALREAGRHLRRRRAIETLGALGQVLELWRDPGSPPRDALAKQLPEATGFSEPVVREGLARALEGWTRESLFELVRNELGGPEAIDEHPGFDTTAVVLAGSLPTPTLLAILAPLVLRSPVLVKPASRDPVTAAIVRKSLAMVDPELADCVAIAPFERTDEARTRALLQAGCVVASGSDETIAALAGLVTPAHRFVGYGHKLSVAALGASPSLDARTAMSALAIDVALWDQQGCCSPVSLFVLGDRDAARRAGAHLADALEEVQQRLPRGEIPVECRAAIAQERDEAAMRAAAGAAVEIHASRSTPSRSTSTEWTVVVEPDATLRPAPLGRFVRIHRVADEAALGAALEPLAAHLSSVGVAGFEATPELPGASRICPLGTIQAPPLAWSRGGRGVLIPLVTIQKD